MIGPRMLFARQKHLLALLDALGGWIGNLDFQKLLFLYCQESGVPAIYEFVPYRYGAFSFTSYSDRRKFVNQGLLEANEHRWALNPVGRAVVSRFVPETQPVPGFLGRYRALRGDALVAETYRRYPFYAIRSEIADRVLEHDAGALARIDAARPVRGEAAILTIGYAGRTLEGYLNQLLRAGVSVLCDVRRNPISRKYGFSKGTLSRGCQGVGIRYEHIPELGVASDRRRELNSQADYDALFRLYVQETLPKQGQSLQGIRRWIEAGERVALTCYEQSPRQCHRGCVAEAVARELGEGSGPIHL